MSTRTSSATILLLLLAACHRAPSREAAAEQADVTTADTAERIECTAPGETTFARTCVVEREGAGLTLRHPDGGFRRLLLTPDGQVRAADGAEPAVVTPLGPNRIEVAIGGARYRLAGPL